jgi:predicted esterase
VCALSIACSAPDESLPVGEAGAGGVVHVDEGGSASAGGGGAGSVGSGGAGGQAWQPTTSDWCGDGYQAIDSSSCFYVPAGPTKGVLLFLHGMLPPDASAATMQALARAAADEHGYVVLFPRGRQGLCAWDPSVEDWYCWPTSRASVDAHAVELMAEMDTRIALLEGHLGVDLSTRYVLGFSNGGYFASYIGLEGWWAPLAGAGLVAAGRSFVDTALLSSEQPPIYIAAGALDGQQIQDSAQNLAYVLSLEGWPHQYVLHPQSGHELSAADFASAWALWSE